MHVLSSLRTDKQAYTFAGETEAQPLEMGVPTPSGAAAEQLDERGIWQRDAVLRVGALAKLVDDAERARGRVLEERGLAQSSPGGQWGRTCGRGFGGIV